MWKKCSNHSYVICVKLALVRAVEKLDSHHSFAILPGVSLQKRNDNGGGVAIDEEITVRNDLNEALDRYLAKKIRKYLYSLSLNVKLLDKNTIDDNMRSWNDVISHSSLDETGKVESDLNYSLSIITLSITVFQFFVRSR